MDIGARELILVAVVILIVFGSKRIPGLARSVVDSVRTLRSAFKDDASRAIAKR